MIKKEAKPKLFFVEIFVRFKLDLFNLSLLVLRFICSFILLTIVCLFAVIVYLISVRFSFHLCLNSKIFLFILSFIYIFNLSFTRFEICLFIYIST